MGNGWEGKGGNGRGWEGKGGNGREETVGGGGRQGWAREGRYTVKGIPRQTNV